MPYSHRAYASRISIHALREEGDLKSLFSSAGAGKFLSTPSARRATSGNLGRIQNGADFYPRPPRGGRPPTRIPASTHTYFYPRPPRGGRPETLRNPCTNERFLSTPSARRATPPHHSFCPQERISIHALREEGDQPRPIYPAPPGYFYPRPPRGGRQPYT